MTFLASSARHYAHVEEDDPALFARIKAHVAAGRWEAIGGMAIEPDTNMPSAEAFLRQILHGQRWFESRFGARHRTAWLPDTFGFTGALPQILRHGGLDAMVTIKVTWNETDRLPDNLFRWIGTDGSRGAGPHLRRQGARRLQHVDDARRAGRGLGQPQGRGPVRHRDRLLRLGRRRRRARPRPGRGAAGPEPHARDPRGRARLDPGAPRPAARRTSRGRRAPDVAGRDVPRVPPRDADHAGAHQAAQPPAEAALVGGRGGGRARGAGGDRRAACPTSTPTGRSLLAQPVPRHPPRLLDPRGLRGDRARARRASPSGARRPRARRSSRAAAAGRAPPGLAVANLSGSAKARWQVECAEPLPAGFAAPEGRATAGSRPSTAPSRRSRWPSSRARRPGPASRRRADRLANGLVEVRLDDQGRLASIRDLRRGRELVDGAANRLMVSRNDLPHAYDAWDLEAGHDLGAEEIDGARPAGRSRPRGRTSPRSPLARAWASEPDRPAASGSGPTRPGSRSAPGSTGTTAAPACGRWSPSRCWPSRRPSTRRSA